MIAACNCQCCRRHLENSALTNPLNQVWARETHLTNAEGKRIVHTAKQFKEENESLKELVKECLETVLPKMNCNVEAWHLQLDWCKRARAKIGGKDA